jgi:hypothetical protein
LYARNGLPRAVVLRALVVVEARPQALRERPGERVEPGEDVGRQGPFGRSLVYDITGALLLDRKDAADVTVARFTLDLDRTSYHYNFNLEKRERLLREHGDDVRLDVVADLGNVLGGLFTQW